MLQLPRLGHMLPRLLALLSLQRNADKLMMRSGTPRKSSKGSTEMVRGNGTGRELDSKLLHLRHLLLSPLLHLPQFLVTPHLHPQHLVPMLLVPTLHLDLAQLLDLHLRHMRQLPHLLFCSSPWFPQGWET